MRKDSLIEMLIGTYLGVLETYVKDFHKPVHIIVRRKFGITAPKLSRIQHIPGELLAEYYLPCGKNRLWQSHSLSDAGELSAGPGYGDTAETPFQRSGCWKNRHSFDRRRIPLQIFSGSSILCQ